MISHEQMVEAARRTRKTLYIVSGLYVAIGFVVLIAAALAGDPLSAFLGFVIVSGALSVAIVLNVVLRLSARVHAIDDGVEDIRARLDRIEKSSVLGDTSATAIPSDRDPNMLDLAAIGPGDPILLAAATLDRDVFPRLVKTMEEAPPPHPSQSDESPVAEYSLTGREQLGSRLSESAAMETESAVVSLKNLLRTWKQAIREGDLAACRSVFATLVDTANTETVAVFAAELEKLADRTEAALRAEFARRVREGDFTAALAVGETITSLLPERSVAAEFDRLKPHLQRRLEAEGGHHGNEVTASRVRA